MPIVVSHQPPMELLAQAGYEAGAGEFLQQQRQMQQRERMQIRSIRAQILQDQMRQMSADRRSAMSIGANLASQEMARRNARELQDIRHKNQLDYLRQQGEQAAALQATRYENALQADQAQALHALASDRFEAISDLISDGFSYSPEAMKQYNEALALRKAAADPTLKPIQSAQLLYQASLKTPVPEQPPTDDLQQWMDNNIQPYQTESGAEVLVSRDANGKPSFFQPDPPDPDEADADLSDWDRYRKSDNFMKDYIALFDKMTDEQVIETQGKDLEVSKRTELVFPKHEDIMERMRKAHQPESEENNQPVPEPVPQKGQPKSQSKTKPVSPTESLNKTRWRVDEEGVWHRVKAGSK